MIGAKNIDRVDREHLVLPWGNSPAGSKNLPVAGARNPTHFPGFPPGLQTKVGPATRSTMVNPRGTYSFEALYDGKREKQSSM